MRYPSAKGIVFRAIVWGVVLIFIASIAAVPGQARWYVAIGAASLMSLMLWIYFGTFYEFKETYLLIRMGPFFQSIPYDKITSARKFRGLTSSMALSSDMIELRHGKNYITGTTFISPRDRDGFLV